MTLTAPRVYNLLNLVDVCRPWKLDATNTARRMSNRAQAAYRIALSENHLAGMQPRITFAMAQCTATVQTLSDLTQYAWQYNDRVDNGRTRVVRFVAMPALRSANQYIAQNSAGGENYANSSSWTQNKASVFPTDIVTGSFEIDARPESGAAPGSNTVQDAAVTERLFAYGGLQLLDVVVQDAPLETMEPGVDLCVKPDSAAIGSPVTNSTMECLANTAHELRSTLLPIDVCWSAQSVNGVWSTAQTNVGDATGLLVSNVTAGNGNWVSLLDQTLNARTAESPGVMCHAQYCGTGTPNKTNGVKVPVLFRVRATTNASSAEVKLVGPEHVTPNEATITVTSTGGAWASNTGTYVYLNSNAADTLATTNRNKLDLLARVTGGCLWIHATIGERMFE